MEAYLNVKKQQNKIRQEMHECINYVIFTQQTLNQQAFTTQFRR